ncbi:MAG: hypothetical protein ACI86M_002016 [Saprospiraceae bacterium]
MILKTYVMQQFKSIHKLSEISVCSTSNEMLFSSFTRVLKSFRLNGINRMLNSVKGVGLSAGHMFQVIFILPFVNVDNIHRLFRSGLASQLKGGDNTYYRFLNKPLVPGRKNLTAFVNQYVKASFRVSTLDKAISSPSCLICDDSLLEKRG